MLPTKDIVQFKLNERSTENDIGKNNSCEKKFNFTANPITDYISTTRSGTTLHSGGANLKKWGDSNPIA